jgi:23S rRNA (cytidine2498-2'-O)-methyltransferase
MVLQLHTCKPGFEDTLARELALLNGLRDPSGGDGFVLARAPGNASPTDVCYAVFSVLDAREVAATSVNAMAGALCDLFWECFRGERLEQPWFLHLDSVPHEAVAGRRRTVQAEFERRLRGKMSRVAKLASDDLPADERERRGFFAYFVDDEHVIAGSRLRFWGQRRMRDNPRAPSRAFLKAEEAFALLGHGPGRGDSVIDLGAAPGGWSFSAAERGATVSAVDNGPLRGGALEHPRITHIRADAFRYQPQGGRRCDWLLCDLIEDPNRVVEQILLPWLDAGWCRRFVVNLKVGKMDPVELLRRLRGLEPNGLNQRCASLRIRQLFHDREEITCMGSSA